MVTQWPAMFWGTPGRGVDFGNRNKPSDGNWLERAGDLAGSTNGQRCIIAFGFKLKADLSDYGGAEVYLGNEGVPFGSNGISFSEVESRFRISFEKPSSSDTVVSLPASVSFGRNQRFHTVLAAFDLATAGARHLYIDDEDVLNTESANFVFNQGETARFESSVGHVIAALSDQDQTSVSGDFPGCIERLYMNFSAYLDFSVEANRRKFYTASGASVDIGTDGSLPTGSPPIILFQGLDNMKAGINSGTGGDFTKEGAGALRACR